MAYQNNIESIFSLNIFTKTEKLARFAEVQKNWYLLPAGNLFYKGRMKIMGNNENVETNSHTRDSFIWNFLVAENFLSMLLLVIRRV